jgi:hypothetical protein
MSSAEGPIRKTLIHLDVMRGEQGAELGLRRDRDTLGIAWSGQAGRIEAPSSIRELGGREGDDLTCGIVTVTALKIVEITTGCSHNDDSAVW